MGERRCCEENAVHSETLSPTGALHHMGPLSGMHLQDEIEFGLIAAEVTAMSFGR